MVKHTQTKWSNTLKHFVGLALKGLNKNQIKLSISISQQEIIISFSKVILSSILFAGKTIFVALVNTLRAYN